MTTDGTLGRATSLVGPQFNVTADLGQTRGPNLFHSFSRLDLSQGEAAVFSGPGSIRNVLARVTGGAASSIDGTLRCTIPGANFYLINPAGVVFGPNAALDVQGSFAVTSADQIKLADGGVFHASNPAASVLTTAAPAAFGFLRPNPGTISVNQSTLQVPDGKTFAAVGGNVQIVGGTIQATGGRAAVASAASSGDVTIDSNTLQITGATTPTFGAVSLTDGSGVITDGPSSSAVQIRAGSLQVQQSVVSANTDSGGGTIDISLSGPLTLSQGSIAADGNGAAPAGAINIAAGDVTVDQGGIVSRSAGTGPSGTITINADSLRLTNSAISVESLDVGDAGSISMNSSGAVTLDGQGAGSPNGLIADADMGSAGSAGRISLLAGSLQIVNGALISASTSGGAGAGGRINVTVAGDALLSGTDATLVQGSGISAVTNSSGPAGDITLSAASLHVLNGASIASGTDGAGPGGNVTVATTGPLVLDAQNFNGTFTEISARAFLGTGNAGNVNVNAGSLQVLNGARINSDTNTPGAGGTVTLRVAGPLTVFGQGAPSGPSSRGSSVSTSSFFTGKAGDIDIAAGSVSLLDGGTISSDAGFQGDGGNVVIRTPGTLLIDGQRFGQNRAGIESSTLQTARAGNIDVTAGALTILNGAQISAATFGTGPGGNVTLNVSGPMNVSGADPVSGANSGVFAATNATDQGGPAGNISISAGTLLLQDNASISSDTFGPGAAGDVNVSVAGQATAYGGSGVFSRSQSTGAGGNAGGITFKAASLQLVSGSAISSNTAGQGNGGTVVVAADGPILLDPQGTTELSTGVFAVGSAGAAGSVTLSASALQMVDGAKISSSATSTGAGGAVNVTVTGPVDVEGAGSAIKSQSESAGAGGNAGSVSLNAGELHLINGGIVSSATFGRGAGGRVDVNVSGPAIIAGTDEAGVRSGVLSESRSTGAGGNAGKITVTAQGLGLQDGGRISSSTLGAGQGGDAGVFVPAGAILIRGQDQPGIFATTGGSASGGHGGNIGVLAHVLQMSDTAVLDTNTAGGGAAGNVEVVAISMSVVGGATLQSLSTGTGAAGTVSAIALRSMRWGPGSGAMTSAPQSAGGNIMLGVEAVQPGMPGDKPRSLRLNGTTISSTAGSNGGNITFAAPGGTVQISHSRITAQSSGANGGNIVIDPSAVILRNTVVSANAFNNGGNITIRPDVFFEDAATSITATGIKGIPGIVALSDPNPQIVNSLVPLPTTFAATQLQPQCGLLFQGSDVSSFILTGQGGTPPQPQGWLPDTPADLAR